MKHHLLVSLILLALSLKAQTKNEIEAAAQFIQSPVSQSQILEELDSVQTTVSIKGTPSDTDQRNFLDFYIPSAILVFGIEPASVSKVTLGLTDTKFNFKYGFRPKENTSSSKLFSGFGVAAGAKLSDGARVLFSRDDIPKDFSLDFIYTRVVRDVVYMRNQKDLGLSPTFASNNARWINLSLTGNVSQKNIFSSDTIFVKRSNLNAQFLVSFTNLFNSLYGSYKYGRNIFNIGLGYGLFDNYESLNSYTLRRGIINVNQKYFGETKVVIGKKGSFKKINGVIGTISAFYPLTSPVKLTTLIIGANGNVFAPESTEVSANVNGGFFLSQRSFDSDKKLKENFSFGLIAVFDQLQDRGEGEYFRENFSVRLTAQIPISFR